MAYWKTSRYACKITFETIDIDIHILYRHHRVKSRYGAHSRPGVPTDMALQVFLKLIS